MELADRRNRLDELPELGRKVFDKDRLPARLRAAGRNALRRRQ